MTTITLAIQWRGHQPGDTVDVDQATAEWLRRTGATAPEPGREPEPDAPADPEPDPASAPEAPAEAPKRPARTAPVATWRAYADALGIDPKGLTKAEIIAATMGA